MTSILSFLYLMAFLGAYILGYLWVKYVVERLTIISLFFFGLSLLCYEVNISAAFFMAFLLWGTYVGKIAVSQYKYAW